MNEMGGGGHGEGCQRWVMLLLSLADSVPLVGRKRGSLPGFLLFFQAPDPL